MIKAMVKDAKVEFATTGTGQEVMCDMAMLIHEIIANLIHANSIPKEDFLETALDLVDLHAEALRESFKEIYKEENK